MIRCAAFDCFGTVFDASSLPRDEVRKYVEHVNREDFSPFEFSDQWWTLPAHADAATGIARLRAAGVLCVTLSNGSAELIAKLSDAAGIEWDRIIDLVKHRAYKPKNLNAYRAVHQETGIPPHDTLMVTANPTFGDIESAQAVGMQAVAIRGDAAIQDIDQLCSSLVAKGAWK